MKILEVTCNDLPGGIFNGYDLHNSLKELGYDIKQMVKRKYSDCGTVKSFCNDEFCLSQVIEWERVHSVSHVMIPFGYVLKKSSEFQEADIVHYHILHNHTISLLHYAELMNQKCSLWTIHDMWIMTGNCIQPTECLKWMTGCGNCPLLTEGPFMMEQDNTEFMWNVKKQVLSQINPEIVVASDYIKKCITKSPLTRHFDKIHVIPFGIASEKYNVSEKALKKKKFHIPVEHKVIGFRADDSYIKGCAYLYEALEKIGAYSDITLLCVGEGTVPNRITDKYNIMELGLVHNQDKMIDFFEAVDIFVMPSLSEGFGLMSIEAMAAGCAVICFKGTVLEEITDSPLCGVAVDYKSTGALAAAIERLIGNYSEMETRGKLGYELVKNKYRFEDYVEKHRRLYEKLYEDYCKTGVIQR